MTPHHLHPAVTDDQLRATADTRPGYATYPDTPPGSPCWWARHGDHPPRRPAPEPRPWTGPDQMLRDRPAPTAGPPPLPERIDDGTKPLPPIPDSAYPPDAMPLPDPDRSERLRQAITQAIATGKPVDLADGSARIEPAPRRWWHRWTRRPR